MEDKMTDSMTVADNSEAAEKSGERADGSAASAADSPEEKAESASSRAEKAETEKTEEKSADFDESGDSAMKMPPVSEEQNTENPLFSEKQALEEELAAMREELRRKKEEKELLALFPELEGMPLPDEVTAMAEKGIPLAASYALFHCRAERKKQLAAEEQTKNRLRSSGSLGSGAGGMGEGGFTLAEISAMSPKEVRKHYREILRSLEKGR